MCMQNEVGKLEILSMKNMVINSGGEKNERRVGLTLDQDMKKCVQVYYQLSKRILVVKRKGKTFINKTKYRRRN